MTATQFHPSANDTWIRFDILPTTDTQAPFGLLEASLSRGALARAQIPVALAGSSTVAMRDVFATVPGPVAPGSLSRWGFAVSNTGQNATLVELRVEPVDGSVLFDSSATPVARYPLSNEQVGDDRFARVLGLSDQLIDKGNWTLTESSATWSGSLPLLANAMSDLVVDLPIHPDAPPSEYVPWTLPVARMTFPNGYVHEARHMRVPHVLEASIPPETTPGAGDGYPWAANVMRNIAYTYAVEVDTDRGSPTGTGTYTLIPAAVGDDLARARTALFESRVTFDRSRVRIGETVTWRANHSLVASETGEVAHEAGVFAPLGLGKAPVSLDDSTRGTVLAQVLEAVAADVDAVSARSEIVALTANGYVAILAGDSGEVRLAWDAELVPRFLRVASTTLTAPDRILVGAADRVRVFSTTGQHLGDVVLPDGHDLADALLAHAAPGMPRYVLLANAGTDSVAHLADAEVHALVSSLPLSGNADELAHDTGTGTVAASTSTHVSRLDLSPLAFALAWTQAVDGPGWLHVDEQGRTLFAGTNQIYRFTATGARTDTDAILAPVSVSFGHVTGSPDLDVVFVTDPQHVRILDGGTFALTSFDASEALHYTRVADEETCETQAFAGFNEKYGYDVEACFQVPETYASEVEMRGVHVTSNGRILASRASPSALTLASYTPEGDLEWQSGATSTAYAPLVVLGERADGIEPGFLTSDARGRVRLVAADDGRETWVSKPGAPTGVFEGEIRVPLGGIFGTHVVESELTWTVDTAQGAREARASILGLFDATDPFGRIPKVPIYEIILHVGMRG